MNYSIVKIILLYELVKTDQFVEFQIKVFSYVYHNSEIFLCKQNVTSHCNQALRL